MLLHSLSSWMTKLTSAAGRRKQPRPFRPALEHLEERTLLSGTGYFLQHLNSGVYVNSYAGVGFIRDQVATLFGPTGLTASNTSIQINWGDGKTSAGELADVGPNGLGTEVYQVKGSHIYQQLASGKQITVTVAGHTQTIETAEAYVSAMPSGQPGKPPPDARPSGDPANVGVQLQHLNSGVYVNTQVGNTTSVLVGSFGASLNGQPDITATPKGHFAAYINWGNSSGWTTAQIVPQGPSSRGWYNLYGSPPPYAQPTTGDQLMPIVVYLTGPDGTSTTMQTAEAIVAPGTLTNTIAAELRQVLPSAPAPTVTQTGNVVTVQWGGLTISNNLSGAAPLAVSRESPGDVKTFVDMLQNAVSASPSLKTLLGQIVNDPAHPVTALVGSFIGTDRAGPVFFDQYATNTIDVGQLGQLPTALPADQGMTQGEMIAHILGERRYGALHGADLGPAHVLGGIPAQNDYRSDIGATSRVEYAVPAPPTAGYLEAGQDLYTGGQRQVIQLDPSFHIQINPVTTTPPPSTLGTVSNALTHSTEYYSSFVSDAYQNYLGRAPSQAELNTWVQAMQNGLSDERLEAGFIGSAEYIAHHGGAGAGWVTGMYHDLLGRAPLPQEVDAWVHALNNGVSPQEVAYDFAASGEREGIRVTNDYQTYLGRRPTQAEVSAWVNAFLGGTSNEDVIAGFIGSAERFVQSGSDLPNWLDTAYLSILGRHADNNAMNSWVPVLVQGLPPA